MFTKIAAPMFAVSAVAFPGGWGGDSNDTVDDLMNGSMGPGMNGSMDDSTTTEAMPGDMGTTEWNDMGNTTEMEMGTTEGAPMNPCWSAYYMWEMYCNDMNWTDVCEAGFCRHQLMVARSRCTNETMWNDDGEEELMKESVEKLLASCEPCMWRVRALEGMCDKCEGGCLDTVAWMEMECENVTFEHEGKVESIAEFAAEIRPDLEHWCEPCMQDFMKLYRGEDDDEDKICDGLCDQGSPCFMTARYVAHACMDTNITYEEYGMMKSLSVGNIARMLLDSCNAPRAPECRVMNRTKAMELNAIIVPKDFCGGEMDKMDEM